MPPVTTRPSGSGRVRIGRPPSRTRPIRDASRVGRVPYGTRPVQDASRIRAVPDPRRPGSAPSRIRAVPDASRSQTSPKTRCGPRGTFIPPAVPPHEDPRNASGIPPTIILLIKKYVSGDQAAPRRDQVAVHERGAGKQSRRSRGRGEQRSYCLFSSAPRVRTPFRGGRGLLCACVIRRRGRHPI